MRTVELSVEAKFTEGVESCEGTVTILYWIGGPARNCIKLNSWFCED